MVYGFFSLHVVLKGFWAKSLEAEVVLNALARVNEWRLLVAALQDLGRQLVFCNIAMTSMDRSCHWQHACDMLAGLKRSRLAPDIISYTSCMGACVSSLYWEAMLKLMSQSDAVSFGSDAAQNVATSGLAKAQDWKGAVWLLSDRRQQRMQLSDKAILEHSC